MRMLSYFFFLTLFVYVHSNNTLFPNNFLNYNYTSLGPVPLGVTVSPNITSYLRVAALTPYPCDVCQGNSEWISTVRGFKFWEYMTNTRPNPGIFADNKLYGVNVTIINTGFSATPDSVCQSITNGTYGKFDVVFPPISSGWTTECMQILNNYNSIFISPWAYVRNVYECDSTWETLPPCTGPDSRRFNNLWTIQAPNDLYWDSAFNLLKLKGAATLAVWLCNDPTAFAEATGGVSSASRNNFVIINAPFVVTNMSITPDVTQNPFYLSAYTPLASDFSVLVRALIPLNADVILSGIYALPSSCSQYVQAMKQYNLSPSACLMHGCIGVSPPDTDLRYIIDIGLWDPLLHGIDYADTIDWKTNDNGISSVSLFDQTFHNYFNVLPDEVVVMPFAAGYAYELVVKKAGTANTNLIPPYFAYISETTIWGDMAFDGYGMDSGRQTLYYQQNSSGSTVIVYPLGSSNGEIIYPFVDWDSRIFNPTFLGTNEEIVMFALYILEIIYTAVCFGILYKNWERRSIKASSPIFMTIMLIGSLMIYSTVPSWMIWTDVASCHLRLWFLNLGFTLLFGTLTAKTHRIKTLFLLKKMRPKKFSDKKLLILVAGLVAIDFVLLILWSAITRPNANKVVVVLGSGTNDGTLWENLNYLDCFYGTPAMTVFLALAGIEKLVMVGYGLYLSLLLWKYGSSMWVESKQIIFAMYNLIIFTLIGLALQLSLTTEDESTRKVLFVTRSMCIFLSGTITIATILVPRLMDPEGKAHEGKDTTGTKKVDTAVQLNDLEWKFEVLEKKYKELKKRHRETNPDDPLSEDQ